MKTKESVILGRLLQKIAPSIGATVVLEPKWKIAGQITFKNGKRSYFRYNTLDLNPVGSSEIAKDKDYSFFFMKSLGYSVIPNSKTFYAPEWARRIGISNQNIESAYAHAKKIGFPIIVKPNNGSKGSNVTLVSNKQELHQALQIIFKSFRVAIVQKYIKGKDYRVVVLDEKIISGYERIPLNVVGDGKSTITKLINKKQRSFDVSHRDTVIDLSDKRISNKLKRQKLTLESILPSGKQVFLLDNANLSSGGDSVDVTSKIHPGFKEIAIKLTRDMGLRLCGVDLIIDGDISEEPTNYWIIEINAAPGLDHYVTIGNEQEKIVENLYLKVLKHMEK